MREGYSFRRIKEKTRGVWEKQDDNTSTTVKNKLIKWDIHLHNSFQQYAQASVWSFMDVKTNAHLHIQEVKNPTWSGHQGLFFATCLICRCLFPFSFNYKCTHWNIVNFNDEKIWTAETVKWISRKTGVQWVFPVFDRDRVVFEQKGFLRFIASTWLNLWADEIFLWA